MIPLSAVNVTATTPAWKDWRLNPASATPPTSTMLKNQPQLPNLPVPALDSTLAKVLKSCRAVAQSDAEYETFKSKVEEFSKAGGLGRTLQERLEAKRNDPECRNWIAEDWDMDCYMKYRDSVVVNVSYYYGFERLPQSPPSSTSATVGESNPAYVAASIASTALEFRRLISEGVLEPEQVGKPGDGELCMESYKWAFNACRVPALPGDYAVKVREDSPESQFMVVVRKNQFWQVALQDSTGKEFTLEELRRAFQHIYEHDPKTALPAVGIMTGINRDHWTAAHTHLMSSSPTNAATLAAIRQSAFVFCLDTATPDPALAPLTSAPTSLSSEGIKEFSSRLWKGDAEGGNRWWDKPLQWIIFANGEAGFIGEHSCMDGTPTARMNDFISKRLITNSPTPVGLSLPFSPSSLPTTTVLPFVLDSISQAQIQAATKEFKDHVDKYEVHYVKYSRYGKDGIKSMKTSPDGWTQQIFQLAYYMTHARPCGTYEAAQVRRFQLGRTETVRTCTTESVEWSKAMLDPSKSNGEKRDLFRKAVKVHGSEMKDASSGMGVDRHLFGLRHLIKDGETSSFLTDPLLARSSTWSMSTSQIYIRHAPSYGWGPVVSDGYGIPYMIHPECLQFTVTCAAGVPGKQFIENLEKASDMLMDVMVAAEKESKL